MTTVGSTVILLCRRLFLPWPLFYSLLLFGSEVCPVRHAWVTDHCDTCFFHDARSVVTLLSREFLGRITKTNWLGYALGGLCGGLWALCTFSQWYATPTFRFGSQLFGVLTGDLFRGFQNPSALYPFKAATLGYLLCLIGLGRGLFP